MWRVSDRFLRTIAGPHRTAAWIEFRNSADDSWTPLTVVDGSVAVDRGSQTRWSLDATVTDMGELTPYSSMMQVYTGVYVSTDVEWVPLGLYRLESMQQQTDSAGVKITGLSREAIIKDAGFLVPRTVRGDAETAITELIREVIPDAYIDFRVSANTVDSITEDQDRWKVIAGTSDDPSIANALGAEVFCDAIGRFVVAAVPTLNRAPVWEAGTGVLVSSSSSESREGVHNVVVATGESLGEGEQAGPGYAWDDDPYSPTFAGVDLFDSAPGPFGRVVSFYNSSALKNTGDCERAAQGQLADSLGLKRTVKFTSVRNPALVPGDVVRINPPGDRLSDHVIDSISIPLVGGSIDVDTRTSRGL